MSAQYVVLLTGGYAPPGHAGRAGHEKRQEGGHVLAMAQDKLVEGGLDSALAEMWQAGWNAAAVHYRIVTCWAFEDAAEAERFARFVTAEIDPAYVMAARSPVHELLACLASQQERGKADDPATEPG
jgi:hypothetical protein